MKEDLRKKLEEAAEKYAIKHRADYLPEDCYASEHKEGFLAGAKYGYKEAIKVAKEWMRDSDNFYQSGSEEYPDVTVMADTIGEMIDTFETDMNKLLEEKK